jgi:hypothetical protein
MPRELGRDATRGYVWLDKPYIERVGGPERISAKPQDDDPPYEPRPVLGFTAPEKPEPRHNPLAENCAERGSAWLHGQRCVACPDGRES